MASRSSALSGEKVNPMSPERSVTCVSGRSPFTAAQAAVPVAPAHFFPST